MKNYENLNKTNKRYYTPQKDNYKTHSFNSDDFELTDNNINKINYDDITYTQTKTIPTSFHNKQQQEKEREDYIEILNENQRLIKRMNDLKTVIKIKDESIIELKNVIQELQNIITSFENENHKMQKKINSDKFLIMKLQNELYNLQSENHKFKEDNDDFDFRKNDKYLSRDIEEKEKSGLEYFKTKYSEDSSPEKYYKGTDIYEGNNKKTKDYNEGKNISNNINRKYVNDYLNNNEIIESIEESTENLNEQKEKGNEKDVFNNTVPESRNFINIYPEEIKRNNYTTINDFNKINENEIKKNNNNINRNTEETIINTDISKNTKNNNGGNNFEQSPINKEIPRNILKEEFINTNSNSTKNIKNDNYPEKQSIIYNMQPNKSRNKSPENSKSASSRRVHRKNISQLLHFNYNKPKEEIKKDLKSFALSNEYTYETAKPKVSKEKNDYFRENNNKKRTNETKAIPNEGFIQIPPDFLQFQDEGHPHIHSHFHNHQIFHNHGHNIMIQPMPMNDGMMSFFPFEAGMVIPGNGFIPFAP